MKAYQETIASANVTPKLLRQWANDLIVAMGKANLGEHTPRITIYGDNLRIELIADQDAWHQHNADDKSKWV